MGDIIAHAAWCNERLMDGPTLYLEILIYMPGKDLINRAENWVA